MARAHACGHIVPPAQLLCLALGKGPSGGSLDFAHRARGAPAAMDELGQLLLNVCRVVPQAQTRQQQPEPGLTLVFAPLKRDTTNLVVEKATELGATRLLPVFTTHTNAGRLNLERCHAIACEAAVLCVCAALFACEAA